MQNQANMAKIVNPLILNGKAYKLQPIFDPLGMQHLKNMKENGPKIENKNS